MATTVIRCPKCKGQYVKAPVQWHVDWQGKCPYCQWLKMSTALDLAATVISSDSGIQLSNVDKPSYAIRRDLLKEVAAMDRSEEER